jgi:hypothetical protein
MTFDQAVIDANLSGERAFDMISFCASVREPGLIEHAIGAIVKMVNDVTAVSARNVNDWDSDD